MTVPGSTFSSPGFRIRIAIAVLAGGLLLLFLWPEQAVFHPLIAALGFGWLALAGGLAWRERKSIPETLLAVAVLLPLLTWLSVRFPDGHRLAPWFPIPNWFPREALKTTQAGWFLLHAVALGSLVLFVLARRARAAGLAALILVIGAASCFKGLFKVLKGGVLYGDDHPAFLYRMKMLLESFPSITYWSPWWNAGQFETAAASSGIALQAPAWMPLAWMFGLENAQPLHVALAMFVYTPVLLMLAVRWFGGGAAAMVAGGVLGMVSGHEIFKWGLHFGTLGAAFSMPFIPAVAGLTFRILTHERPTLLRHGLPLTLLLFGAMSWPPGIAMLVPIAVGFLFSVRPVRGRNLAVLAAAGLVAAALLLPGALAKLSNPVAIAFLERDTPKTAWTAAFAAGTAKLYQNLSQFNPAIVFLGIAGVLSLPGGGRRGRFLIPAVLVFFLLAGWGEVVKPQLQLTRAMIALGLLAAVPAALWMGRWMDDPRPSALPFKALSIGLLVVVAQTGGQLARNRGPAPIHAVTPAVVELRDWVRAHVPEDGRFFFAGNSGEFYGRGHVAYLPVWTGRAMVSCDYYHFDMKLVEYDMPPKAWRVNDEAYFRYMDLVNATHAITMDATPMHRDRRAVLDRNPRFFRKVAELGTAARPWHVYEVLRKPDWFIEGSGKITQAVNRLEITLDDPATTAVIKFNWTPKLTAVAPARIEPVEVGPGLTFIRIHPNGAKPVVLRR